MQPKSELISRTLQKSTVALSDALRNFEDGSLDTALNRLYYAVFYSVLALAYKHDFATSKHATLMGWFNKKFVHEEKIFEATLYDTYEDAFEYRQRSDYNMFFTPEKETVERLLQRVREFVATVTEKLLD